MDEPTAAAPAERADDPPMDSALARLVRASPSLRTSLAGVARAAAADAVPLLILGESGTGRSALARAMHDSGPRRDRPLVTVDPGVIPSTLFEGELFGHRAGAFTGADRDRDGRVARAEGGTLILDHVESLPAATQPALLRLLAERTYRPLGGRERACDVRFVALGSDDLPARVEDGVFRADLFYRLEVLAFRLPPLRARADDLPTLCTSLLTDLAQRLGRDAIPTVAPRALAWMRTYAWPGNLRQLRNLLERALIVTPPGSSLDPPPPGDAAAAHAADAPSTLAALEMAHIRRVLAHTRGHQGKAAAILGISRKALWEKRKRHGIP
ncbi:MAG: sigma 54-interacting transcriptional regulator [Acidobacteriota bacterium]